MTPTPDTRGDGGSDQHGQRGYGSQSVPAVSLYAHGWARFNKAAFDRFSAESRADADPEEYECVVIYLHHDRPLLGIRFSTLDVEAACDQYPDAAYILGLGGHDGQLINSRQPLLDVMGVDEGSLDHTLIAEFSYDPEAHLLIADYSVILDHVGVSLEDVTIGEAQSLADENGGDGDE